jgi:hypothetical protein
MGPQAGDSSYTDYSDADMGPVGNYTMFDEATAKAGLQSVVDNMKAKMTNYMNPSQKAAFNLSINNPFTSNFQKFSNFAFSPIGTTLSSFSYNPDLAGDRRYTDYGNTPSYFTTESDGGDTRDGRKFIPSFDTTLLTPDLAKNRDYRLYQGANNPFYSMQAAPSGGINNLYTEFQTGGRVGYAGGGRIGFNKGSFLIDMAKNFFKKKPKTETTSIDPIIDENVDLSKRGFLKGAAGVGAGIAAFGSGALKLAKKGAKEVKDLDVVFRKNYGWRICRWNTNCIF